MKLKCSLICRLDQGAFFRQFTSVYLYTLFHAANLKLKKTIKQKILQ